VESLRIGQKHSDSLLTFDFAGDLSCGGRSLYTFALKPAAVLGRSSTLSNPLFFKIGTPVFIASSPVHNKFHTCASVSRAPGFLATY